MVALQIILLILTVVFVITQIISFVIGMVVRSECLSSSEWYVKSELEDGARDVWTIFWPAWLAGFMLVHKLKNRFNKDYKENRKEKRMARLEGRIGE